MSDYKTQDTNSKTRVLYVHYGDDWIRGSEIVLLDLLKSAKENNYSPLLWCNSNVLAEKATRLGVEVIKDTFVCLGYWTLPRWNFFQFFKLVRRAYKIVNTYNISLVHCNNGAPCQWMVPICKFSGIPLLLHLHARYMFRDRLTLLFHAADTIIGVSQSVIKIFKKNEFNYHSVDVIYNGIDPNRVACCTPRDIRAELSAKRTDFVILYIGSLIPRKSVEQLLYAVDKLKQNYQIKLAIVGSGSEETKLNNLVNQLNLHDKVNFFSPSDNVAEIYSSNAGCFISVPTEEVFGLTLAEASIAKLPIITSNITGIDEIYTHHKNALLVTPNNTDELVGAIKFLIENPQLRNQLAENAQKHIIKTFSVNQQFNAFNNVYQTLFAGKTKQRFIKTLLLHLKIICAAFINKVIRKILNNALAKTFVNTLTNTLKKGCKRVLLRFSWGKNHD